MHQYIALIHKDADSDYGVSFPDLPRCATAAHSLKQALLNAEEALALHLEGMQADNEPIPEPSGLDVIMADRENRDGVAVLVSGKAEVARTVRINITMSDDVLARVDR